MQRFKSMKTFLIAVLVLLSLLIAIPAFGDSQVKLVPLVVAVSASSHPAIPSDLKEIALIDPSSGNPSPTDPVLKWGDYTYWAYSYIDNDYYLAIVAYDAAGNMVGRWDKYGARYIWQITTDPATQTVTFWGQSKKTVTMSFDQLRVPPTVATVSAGSHPAIPSDLKEIALSDPSSGNPSSTDPVLKWGNYTYWAYSYIDNDYYLAIVAYDAAGNMVGRWDKYGTRYIWQITIDATAKTVTFWGQSKTSVTMSFNDLRVPPTVTTVPAGSHPAIPSDLKEIALSDPSSGNPSSTDPVLKWGNYTYWAYSYIDNDYYLAIVAYDAAGNMVGRWDKYGARYIWQITIDAAAKTVTFWGQSKYTVKASWDDLNLF
ncbi:MAG TPA: hypothetical protein DDW50_20015 [Firmicutes bacterium]|jgi:hypothetical protein|nr:hypothetical protein [Bacillota bacterium]